MTQLRRGKQPDLLQGWLNIVTYRRAVDYLRRVHSRREQPITGAVDALAGTEDPHMIVSDREHVELLAREIRRRFRDREARILVLLWIGGLPRAAVAEQIGVSIKRLHKILDGNKGKPGLRARAKPLLDACRDQAVL